jgi:hypothetical protein
MTGAQYQSEWRAHIRARLGEVNFKRLRNLKFDRRGNPKPDRNLFYVEKHFPNLLAEFKQKQGV